ncbi:MAG: hypothetical protein LBE91_12465 [Tannerella sp.]|jgi:hypothetical protein|nr:hypothetical protein [Tannerella sp.]
MFFEDYTYHAQAVISSKLFWEYDLKGFDFEKMKNVVVERVIERGRMDDWYAMLNLYGVNEVVQVIKNLPYLNRKDANFVQAVFDISPNEMKCLQKKYQHWG